MPVGLISKMTESGQTFLAARYPDGSEKYVVFYNRPTPIVYEGSLVTLRVPAWPRCDGTLSFEEANITAADLNAPYVEAQTGILDCNLVEDEAELRIVIDVDGARFISTHEAHLVGEWVDINIDSFEIES